MAAFMDTTATIPTGSMAERWKWKSFAIWGLFCGAIYYPLFAAWTWGGGWLAKTWDTMSLGTGYVDFAGSGVVHAVGGVAALAGALVLGPRIGKYGPDGKPNTIAGHNIPMAMLGCFILLFGWFGFNAASTLAVTDIQFATVATNTAIAAAVGATVAMYYMMAKTGKPDPGMMVNGMLAGLVAITAPCAFVAPWAAAVIGALAAIIVIEAAMFIERKGIDDPVGAIAVHGVGGIFGVLCVGIFANGQYGAGWNGAVDDAGNPIKIEGLIEGKFGQFGAQVVGALTILIVIFGDRLRLLQDPEQAHQGRHPLARGRRDRRRRHPRDGRPRLRRLTRPNSLAPFVPGHCARGRRRLRLRRRWGRSGLARRHHRKPRGSRRVGVHG